MAQCLLMGLSSILRIFTGSVAMISMTNLVRGRLTRVVGLLGLGVLVVLAGIAPASAQARLDNGRHVGRNKERKAERKAERESARRGAVVVVPSDGRVIDRSRTRVQRPRRDDRYYRNNNTRVYDYRNSRVDPYAQYPQYRRYPSNSYPYGNNNGYPYGYSSAPYYDNREGDLDREDVARRAAQSGYYAGFQRGQYDAANRHRANPYGHGAYQFGYDGFDPSWGSASTYQQYYRQYFIQGYNDAYSRRGYDRRYNRRW